MLSKRLHKQEVNLAEIGSGHDEDAGIVVVGGEVIIIAVVPADCSLLELLFVSVVEKLLIMGMFLIDVVLIGLETRFDSDLIGDCSSCVSLL